MTSDQFPAVVSGAGNGAKVSRLLGENLSDPVGGRQAKHPIEAFKADRPALRGRWFQMESKLKC